LFYADLADPVALLRGRQEGAQLRRFWAYAASRSEVSTASAAHYSQLMSDSQALVHQTVLASLELGGTRRLLDVGGGEGTFAIAAAQKHPALTCTVFDLPAVAGLATARIAGAGLSDRITVVAGDFRNDRLPAGADCVSFVRVLHDHDDDVVARLLLQARESLVAGGRVAIAEPLAAEPSSPRVGDTYFGFYLLAMGQGRPRSAAAYAALLKSAGFIEPHHRATSLPLASGLVVAESPGSVV
jgi:demethylspheroidene O-methyltransferase